MVKRTKWGGLWSKMSCFTLPSCHQQRDSLTWLTAVKQMPSTHTSCFAAARQSRRKGNLRQWDGVDICGENFFKLLSPCFPVTQKYLYLLRKLHWKVIPLQCELLHSTDNIISAFTPFPYNSDYMSFLACPHKMLIVKSHHYPEELTVSYDDN